MLDSMARSVIYPAPPFSVPSPPPDPLEEVRLELPPSAKPGAPELPRSAAGAEIVAWLDESGAGDGAGDREGDPPAPLVLFFHGNGENLETLRRAGTFESFRRLGAAVLAVDYPGYGRSGGQPSEGALAAAADAALTWAVEHRPQRPRVVAGWSLGAAVALGLAARSGEELAGVMALSAWTSLPAVAEKHFPGPVVRYALKESYDSLEVAGKIRLPTLVVHGADDGIIPARQGREVAQALAGEVTWVPVEGAGHNDLMARQEPWRAMEEFLARLNLSP